MVRSKTRRCCPWVLARQTACPGSPSYNRPVISVVLATRNRANILDVTLGHISRQRVDDNWEIVIADNGSSDHTPDILARWRGDLPLRGVCVEEPGKSRALNAALQLATGDLLVFTDDDIIPRADWLQRTAAAARAWPGHSVFGGRIVLAPASRGTGLAVRPRRESGQLCSLRSRRREWAYHCHPLRAEFRRTRRGHAGPAIRGIRRSGRVRRIRYGNGDDAPGRVGRPGTTGGLRRGLRRAPHRSTGATRPTGSVPAKLPDGARTGRALLASQPPVPPVRLWGTTVPLAGRGGRAVADAPSQRSARFEAELRFHRLRGEIMEHRRMSSPREQTGPHRPAPGRGRNA